MFHLNCVMFIKKLEMSITPCFLITVPEGSEMDYEEEPEYTLESLFSDIGGAAGLALGMSLATFFGALEYLIYRMFNLTVRFCRRNWKHLSNHCCKPKEIENNATNVITYNNDI